MDASPTKWSAPCVIDADALNAISFYPSCLKSNLTPHPLEMERLFPQKSRTRRQWLEDFVAEYPVTLLLKGARTLIGERGAPSAYNPTGHPCMATGVAAALLAQGKSPLQSAKLAAWICGHAAELALRDGPAFTHLRAGAL